MLDFLREIGCDQAQGYLISKPLPVADLEEFLDGEKVSVKAGDVLMFCKNR
jgi:diguanylate cyclase